MEAKEKRKIRTLLGKVFCILYILFMCYFLIITDWYGRSGELEEYHYNLTLFREIKRFWEHRETLGMYAVLANIAGNVMIFIPLGFFLPMASKYRNFFMTLFAALGISLGIEVFQFFSRVGRFDVDDLFLNTLGGIIGYIGYEIGVLIRRRNGKKRKTRKK